MFTIGQYVEAIVEKIVFGGHALIRHQGWVIFVDDVLPGEKVCIQITHQKKSYFLATLITILQPSPERIVPLCPYFGHCGGCQLQMVSYARQIVFKKEWLLGILSHRLKLPSPIQLLPAAKEWGYRRKITLHLRFRDKRPILGYYARGSHTLIEVASCAIFRFQDDHFFQQIRSWIAVLEGDEQIEGELTIVQLADTYLMQLVFSSKVPENIHILQVPLPLGCQSLRIVTPKRSIQLGNESVTIGVSGLQIVISVAIFLQNYPEESEKLYRDVVDIVEEGDIFDLYCGVGILTQLLAHRYPNRRVIGIESNQEAIQLAQKSASLNELTNVRFIAGFVENKIKKELDKRQHSIPIWIVNPPREGLSEKIKQLISTFLPEQLIYISCMPSTLERDLFILCEQGYQIRHVQGYDMFPQTTHLETVVVLGRI